MTELQNNLYSEYNDQKLCSEYNDQKLCSEYNDQNQRGDLWTRYKIYCHCLEGTGDYIKSYDEWLNS